jgi:hypothetical protein
MLLKIRAEYFQIHIMAKVLLIVFPKLASTVTSNFLPKILFTKFLNGCP